MRRAVPLSIVCDIASACVRPESFVGHRAGWVDHFNVGSGGDGSGTLRKWKAVATYVSPKDHSRLFDH